jgi:hypothetical protein
MIAAYETYQIFRRGVGSVLWLLRRLHSGRRRPIGPNWDRSYPTRRGNSGGKSPGRNAAQKLDRLGRFGFMRERVDGS